MDHDALVSVVVPAYNAEATLLKTLSSVRRQTYANLEIIVVDDGSTDGTLALAEAAAREDPRVRVLSKGNGGVAEARNAGVQASRGTFVAPVDADDLWHPEKIAKQMAAMAAGGPEMGFVYTFYRRIDEHDCVIYSQTSTFDFSGPVFLRHLVLNFVGNGSSLLMRRAAFDAAGGYDPGLLRQGVQGCEDWLIQLLIARFWTVGVVPEYLTGYRHTPGAMSSSRDRMERSMLAMQDYVRARFPETPDDVLALAEVAVRAPRAVFQLLGMRRPLRAGGEFRRALGREPEAAVRVGWNYLRRHLKVFARRRLLPAAAGPAQERFLDLDPASRPAEVPPHPLRLAVLALEAREEAFFRSRRFAPGTPDRGARADARQEPLFESS